MSGDKPLINVELGSPISVKAEIKTEIPKESSGRLLDALTDAIRPFTESRGLRADQIRLQREDVLIEIAEKAQRRLAIENTKTSAPPNKFLVPFLEKASTEELGSELTDKWASLLVSAATNYNSAYLRFTTVLSEMGHAEAKMLDRVCLSARNGKAPTFIEDAPVEGMDRFIAEALQRGINEIP